MTDPTGSAGPGRVRYQEQGRVGLGVELHSIPMARAELSRRVTKMGLPSL